jgi:hypothetical protein
MNRRLQTDGIIDMAAILVVCRETIKRKYPLISASVYEFAKAICNLSILLSRLEHQQYKPLYHIIDIIYKSYDKYINQGWMAADAFRVWREQHEEMYGQLKMICRKLKKEPRGIIEGVGDIVYI